MLPLLCLLQLDPAALLDALDSKAQTFLRERAAIIRQIDTHAKAEQRQREIRPRLLALHGELPAEKGSLNARVTGSNARDGYTIENVVFESLPQYFVTANVYVPAAKGPHPAILYAMGHWDNGKAAAQLIAGNLARKGFVVLAFDPPGQGERTLYYEPRTGRSLAGGSVDQHLQAGTLAVLAGENISKYFLWDGIRAIDYLETRAEVDRTRIGLFGCSGGGTQATYIAAFDARIKAAAISCYIQSFEQLFRGAIGDSEQSPPKFLSSGFDLTDYVELFAPRPLLVTSTEKDFFTPASAKIVIDEAQRWYGLFGASDRISWNVAPGGHGTPRELREAIYTWFIRWLKNGDGVATELDLDALPDHLLWATPNGHVPGRELTDLIRERFWSVARKGSAAELREYLSKSIGEVSRRRTADAANATTLVIGRAPANLVAGRVYFEPIANAAQKRADDFETDTRCWLIGESAPIVRAREILAALRSFEKPVALEAEGLNGIPALIAAAAEPNRVTKLQLRQTPASLRAAFASNALHRGLMDVAMPGFALQWDLDDLIALIGRDRVEWIDPTDWNGNIVPLGGAYRYTGYWPHPDAPPAGKALRR
jgi:predicted dienelactone hydrolase